MPDILEHIISDDGTFFGVACNCTELVNEACRRHDVGPTAATALARALTGALLMAALLKENQSIMLRFEGNGPLGKVITEAGNDGWARGYVANPHGEVPLKDGRIDVGGGLGLAGFLTVTKTIGDNRRYPGTIQLVSSEIGDDLAYYLAQSDQTPSTIALATHFEPNGTITTCGGYLIQSLPPANETLLANLEKAISTMPPLSQLLLSGKKPVDILSGLFQDVPHHHIGSRKLRYECSCSREKMIQALFSLGKEDIGELLAERIGAEV
jgi:molecular chaperone Hsp33